MTPLPRIVSPAMAELRTAVAQLDRRVSAIERHMAALDRALKALAADRAQHLRAKVAALQSQTPAEMPSATMRRAIRDVARAVATETGIPLDAILGKGKTAPVSEARFRVYAEALEAGFSSAQIGRALGRDHSTVLAGAKRYRAMTGQGGQQ